MARLTNKQIDAITEEVKIVINNSAKAARNSKEYRKLKEKISKKPLDLLSKYKALKEEASKIEKKMKETIDSISLELEDLYLSSYDMDRCIDAKISSMADKQCGLDQPSRNEIERAVIMSDIRGSEDIVDTVLKSLGYKKAE